MSAYFLRTLFVQTPGTRLVLEGDAVKALRDDEPARRLPLNAIDAIVVLGGVDVSTPLMARCGEDGRTVVLLSGFGKPRAIVAGPFGGRGLLRSLQHERRLDSARRSEMASVFVAGKIRQMAWALRQWARDAEPSAGTLLRHHADEISQMQSQLVSASRDTALGVEGAASRRYFQGLALAVRFHHFEGRVKRPPRDAVNAVMSLLYGLTRIAVHGALHAAGLDPYAGFLHGDRDGQPSLVLDMMEEFRPTADRVGITLLNRRQLRDEHFATEVSGAVRFTDDGTRIIFDAWHRHRTAEVLIHGFETPVANACLPLVQANILANALRAHQLYRPHHLAVR